MINALFLFLKKTYFLQQWRRDNNIGNLNYELVRQQLETGKICVLPNDNPTCKCDIHSIVSILTNKKATFSLYLRPDCITHEIIQQKISLVVSCTCLKCLCGMS